jgi:integrase
MCWRSLTGRERTYQVNRLDHLDARADELASRYIETLLVKECSPYTAAKVRSALRLFFGNTDLAATVTLPERSREHITRSRHETKQDRHFQPANWQPLIKFQQAIGLRRSELRDLRIREVSYDHEGHLVVFVRNGKGGKEREVPVLSGRE